MKKTLFPLTILAVLLVLLSLPTLAPAPGGNSWVPSWINQIGCVADFESNQDIAANETVLAVTNPAKLKGFGLKARQGDKVKVTAAGQNTFRLLNIRTGKAVTVVAEKERLKSVGK